MHLWSLLTLLTIITIGLSFCRLIPYWYSIIIENISIHERILEQISETYPPKKI